MESERTTVTISSLPAHGAVVGVVDEQLRVALSTVALAHYFGVSGPLDGASLIDLLVDLDAVNMLRMLARGVITEATLARLPGQGRLVASVTVGEQARRWLLLRHCEPRESPATRSAPVRAIGRAQELAALDAFVASGDGDSIFFVEGPLGIGKTTLLAAFQAHCDELGCTCFTLDARNVAPNDTAILSALYPELGDPSVPSIGSIFQTATRLATRRWVILVDNFDEWGRAVTVPDRLFTSLPSENCRIVVAARRRPRRAWWGDSPRDITLCTLGALAEPHALHLAATLDIDVTARSRALRRAHGHPLSIVALSPRLGSSADREADAIDVLMPGTRTALTQDVLKLAALPVRITEDLLAELLEDESLASTTYDALAELCMRDPDDVGLRMPEAIRQVLRELLRRRNPGRFALLQRRLALYYAKRLEDGSSAYAPTVAADLVDTLGEHPALGQLFGTGDSDVTTRRATPGDIGLVDSTLVAMLGTGAAYDAAAAFEAIPGVVHLIERGGVVIAMVHVTSLTPGALETSDRRRAAAQVALRRLGDEGGPAVLVQAVVPGDAADLPELRHALARLLFSLMVSARNMSAIVTLSELPARSRLLPSGDVTLVDGFSVIVRDLRKASPPSLVEELLDATSDTLASLLSAPLVPTPTMIPISTDDLRFALANLDRLDMLATSPLASLDMCRGDHPAEQLQNALRQALDTLRETPTDRRLHDILAAVYVEKNGKHEQIANDLGIPYGTFRRHLTRGLERVRELLGLRASNSSSAQVKTSEILPLLLSATTSAVSAGEQ